MLSAQCNDWDLVTVLDGCFAFYRESFWVNKKRRFSGVIFRLDALALSVIIIIIY